MATDIYVSNGLNSLQMAELALRYRNEFDVLHVELVDIVNIIEFRLTEIFPGFRLVIKPDRELEAYAISDPATLTMTVKESIYDDACEGDAFARFTLAHELGHYLLHARRPGETRTLHKTPKSYKKSVHSMNARESGESQADMFARHFLAPPPISHKYKSSSVLLAKKTGVPEDIAKGNIAISKRQGMKKLIHLGEKRRIFSDIYQRNTNN